MSSERFETLDEDVQVLLDVLQRKLKNRLPLCSGESRKELIAETERGIDEAQQAIFHMEAEARAAPGSYRLEMMTRVKNHREAVNRLSQTLKAASKNDPTGTRQSLFENQSSSAYAHNRVIDEAMRATVRQGTEILERTSQSLYRSTQVAIETEEVGTGVIQELGQQREALTRTRDRLTDTDTELTRSRRILQSMQRVGLTNKLVLIAIILLEIAILAGLIYYKFIA